jgi:signal transduction histidine kinase
MQSTSAGLPAQSKRIASWLLPVLRKGLIMPVVAAFIAVFLTLLKGKGGWLENFLISLAIGYSTLILAALLRRVWPRCPPLLSYLLVTPLAMPLGFKLAALFGAFDVLGLVLHDVGHYWPVLAVSAMISLVVCLVFAAMERAANYRAELADAQRRAAEAQQAETAAQLRLLQAQIEPHFLFNTLANVQSLIDRDSAMAKTMLDHLNHYLRASLARTRQPVTTLGDELELIENLLAIAAIRLGARLRYRIEVAPRLDQASLPPLLLQPLVENALLHGIEPALDGGEVIIRAECRDTALVLTVCDSGVGLHNEKPSHRESGVGLVNVRARLASLYGERGRLALYVNQPRGVVAELTLPLSKVRKER